MAPEEHREWSLRTSAPPVGHGNTDRASARNLNLLLVLFGPLVALPSTARCLRIQDS
jgi:hypothetical protein